ncbi:eliciting plant response-like protein [Zymoseptoria brevis]|uniref:Eliciting plant response-like protein n=1 Tax=Zymoseptoria brevis TaxID=1047168 RepID=A0A0F4G664_9PEZI|nr:eliciting plant response-like protein [Zymoseptoria brevis]
MKLTAGFTLLTASIASATTLSYDRGYDNAGNPMTGVACSNGNNGLITRYGFQTYGSIPRFPYIGGSSDIAGWNSAQCGQCYSLSWNGGQPIYILAIDHTLDGLNISEEAMNALTGGQAEAVGRVDAQVTKVGVDMCGLAPRKRAVEFLA